MKNHLFSMIALLAVSLNAQNLIKDPEIDLTPLSSEFRLCEDTRQGTLSQFVEDATWNRCLKLELVRYHVNEQGKRSVNLGVLLGGEGKKAGIPCKPDTTYSFSLEIKGTANRSMINFREWDKNGKGKKLRTSIHEIHPQKEWTVYKGTFKTSPAAQRLALVVQFWGNESPKPTQLKEKLGDYILLDKIKIEEVKTPLMQHVPVKTASSMKNIVPASVCIAPTSKDKAFVITGFKDLRIDRPAKLPSTAKLYADDKAIHVSFEFRGAAPKTAYSGTGGRDIWKDDFAELFFDSPVPDGKIRQFVISAGGGRWMGDGTKASDNYSAWSAETKVLHDGWNASVTIPYTAIGYEKAPKPGDHIRFNLCREHRVGGSYKVLDLTKGNRMAGDEIVDNSSFSFTNGNNHDRKNWGILFFDTMRPYADAIRKGLSSPELMKQAAEVDLSDPGRAWAQFEALKEADRIARLSKEKFIVAQIPASTDPSIPFLPDELSHPQKKFRLRAARNEYASMTVALANMTPDYEEYRVTLVSGWHRAEAQNEGFMPQAGLKHTDGTVLGSDKFTVRRGVIFRDSDMEKHGRRYDILAKVNEVSSIPVPPGEAGMVWINFDCHNLKPGLYQGKLLVTPLSSGRFLSFKHRRDGLEVKDDSKSVEVELEVLPFSLPEPSSFSFNGFRTAFNKYHIDFMKKYECIMYMITPWHFQCKFNSDGTIRKKTPKSYLEPHIQLIARNVQVPPGLKKVMVAYSAYPIFKRIHCPATIKFDSPEYWNAYREWMKYVDETLRKNGIAREEYTVEVFDEPDPKKNPPAEVCRALAEAKKAVPGIHLSNTNGERNFFEKIAPLVDNWMFGQHIFFDPAEMKKTAVFRNQSSMLSMYACGTSMRQELYRYYRLLAWKAAHCGGQYVSLFQFFEQTPGLDFRKTPSGGVAYDTGKTLVPSVRLENLRIGMNDIRYLRLLESLAKGNTTEAKSARLFLDKATKDVAVIYPHDSRKADEIRTKAIEFILKLSSGR